MELAAAWKPPNDRRIEIDFFGPLERVFFSASFSAYWVCARLQSTGHLRNSATGSRKTSHTCGAALEAGQAQGAQHGAAVGARR